jgi:indolepyruvate decarboxylase
MPNLATQSRRALVHHTLGNGEFDFFRKMAEPVVCASAIMTPQNVAYETERLIGEAFYHRRPVYMAFPADCANQPVVSHAYPLDPPASDTGTLNEASDAIIEILERAKAACVLPGLLAAQAAGRQAVQAFVDASGLPFATMFGDKSVLEEEQPAYVGMYDGRLMDETVRELVESADCVVIVGALMTDFNTGAFTAHLDPEKTIDIRHHHIQVRAKVYPNVEMKDILAELTVRVTKREIRPAIRPLSLGDAVGANNDPITVEAPGETVKLKKYYTLGICRRVSSHQRARSITKS